MCRSNKPSQVDASKDNAERGAAEDNQGFRSYLRNIDPMAEGLVAFQVRQLFRLNMP